MTGRLRPRNDKEATPRNDTTGFVIPNPPVIPNAVRDLSFTPKTKKRDSSASPSE